jgi:hypothetical protein
LINLSLCIATNQKERLINCWRMSGSTDGEKMITFLSHDFTEPRWHEAALKNAYALLGRRRLGYAASFFLLGGRSDIALSYVEPGSITYKAIEAMMVAH